MADHRGFRVTSIPVNARSASADWARYCNRQRHVPIAALEVAGRPAMAFVPNEVLVDDTEPDLVQHLVDRFGAQIVPAPALPEPPNGLGPARGVRPELMPMPTRLRFEVPPTAGARATELLREAYDHSASVTSEMAAGTLGLVAELSSTGRGIGMNTVGQSLVLPLLSAAEGVGEPQGPDPFQWPAYAGRAHVTAAWQLVEAYRKLASVKPLVMVGVLDGGFWLDGRTPGFPAGQPGSDFGNSAMQLNLLDEGVGAGGPNPNKCEAGFPCSWHGNGVASVAVAPVGNWLGIAGTGGSVARPVFFRTELSVSQILRCLQVCLAWGVDILNMSFSKTSWEVVFPTSSWDRSFQFAADNGLILVAAAGNDSLNLPGDNNPRPATRTPGTITVGALDGNYNAAGFSNYGASVDVWAPGVDLSVAPDPDNPDGSLASGTSVAAPFVAGIVAMMRAVKPSLNTFEANQILKNTGWKGVDRVTIGVNALAAVLAAMGGKLPADLAERNDTPQTAAPLYPFGPAGALVPLGNLGDKGIAALSQNSDADWYRFNVTDYSAFTLDMQWYRLLGNVRVELEPDDADSRAGTDVIDNSAPGSARLAGTLAPGSYKLHVHGSMNLYELAVKLAPAPLAPDEFERNDSFEQATRFHLFAPDAPPTLFPEFAVFGPGQYELNIIGSDQDFFRVQVGPAGALPADARVRFFHTDAPLNISLYDADRTLLQQLGGVRSASFVLTPGATSYLKVTSPRTTRYTMAIHYQVDPSHLPSWVHDQYVVPLLDLGDPQPLETGGLRPNYLVDLTRDRQALNRLVLSAANEAALHAELLNDAGVVVATGQVDERGMHKTVSIETSHLPVGRYFLRLRGAADSQTTGPALQIQRLPSFLGMH
jgi:subtilisin family serine protease